MTGSLHIDDPTPTRPRRRLATFGLAVGITLCLATTACGGDESSKGAGEGTGADAKIGPHEFGMSLDELAGRVEAVETDIGSCMSTAGFEYVPVDFERVKEGMEADKTAPGVSDDEYVKQFGFGITTQFAKPGREIGLGEQNVKTIEAMSPSEQEAFNHALLGDNIDATFALTLEAEDFSETGGCTREAVEKAFTAKELSADYLNPGDIALEQDERLLDAISKWSSCLADKGYEYAHPDDIEADLLERLQAVTEGADPEGLSGPAADQLAELQGYETSVAVVATECEVKHVEPVVEEIESEIYGAPQG